MERHEAEEIAQEAVSRALISFASEVQTAADRGVTAALERVGINSKDPTEVQQDLAFLREWRTTTASIRKKGLMTAVGLIITALAAALVLGIKALLID